MIQTNKLLTTSLVLAGLLVSTASSALAAPFNSNNPNIVAEYDSGPHGIVGESEFHEGADIVMRAGNSGNFQQWFYGTSASEGLHGEHSVWRVQKDNQKVNGDWVLVPDAYPEWGDYLVQLVNYLVHTNNYK